ncbi:MAG: hypothetical protein Q7S06_02145 [Nanoarchaeota archaeon]|nr:hypothetical protein [Nanoarchaeota archaeon]
MAPLIEVSEKTLKGLEQLGVSYTLRQKTSNDSVYVPSANLWVAKQRTLQEKNWFETQKELRKQGLSMQTPLKFVEFLKEIKNNHPEIYEDITGVREPWRAEWFDAFFEKRQDGLYMLTENKARTEKLDGNTLMNDRRIDLESWVNNPTSQGLPRKDVREGNLYYWYPRADSVAWFYAGSDRANLNCGRNPHYWYSGLGVRATRHE